jgi:hypothetical protein
MSVLLNPTGGPVRVGPVELRTPGLQGNAEIRMPGAPGTRAAEQTTDALEQALANEDFKSRHTVEITQPREVPAPAAGVRSTAFGEPAIELRVPAPGDEEGQVVLAADESGVLTWHFPVDQAGQLDVTRGGALRTYVIRRRVVSPPGGQPTRGLVGALGKKVLKVLVFPLVEPVIGAVNHFFAGRWEERKRPYGLHPFTPQNYTTAAAVPVGDDAWGLLSRGRALLLIHGTGSRSYIGFAGLTPEFVAALHERYQGRVFAFDHFTLSHDPQENVRRLLELVPNGVSLDLDILCHSRGGLVARTLAEQGQRFPAGSRSIRVHRVVFVAVPNAGTRLTDTKYLGDLVDAYTNLLNFFPDNTVTDVLEAFLTVVKHLAVGAVKGLDGLQAMVPNGAFLQGLNVGPKDNKQYFALAADYEPTEPGFKDYVANRLMDGIHREANDLVVPTAAVYERNGSELFPIADRHIFTGADGVHHGNFFSQRLTLEKIQQWLS